jgi:hypothetical protein
MTERDEVGSTPDAFAFAGTGDPDFLIALAVTGVFSAGRLSAPPVAKGPSPNAQPGGTAIAAETVIARKSERTLPDRARICLLRPTRRRGTHRRQLRLGVSRL